MTRRLLFAAALLAGVVLALSGWWLLAVAVQVVPAYLAGWWSRVRADGEVAAGLRAELDARDARIVALEDERAAWWNRRAAARWADGSRLMPDNGAGYRSAAAARDYSLPAVPAAPRPAGSLSSPS